MFIHRKLLLHIVRCVVACPYQCDSCSVDEAGLAMACDDCSVGFVLNTGSCGG